LPYGRRRFDGSTAHTQLARVFLNKG
jgi:hypothetical protein